MIMRHNWAESIKKVADMHKDAPIAIPMRKPNHAEALVYAEYKHDESNLARCYLELNMQAEFYKKMVALIRHHTNELPLAFLHDFDRLDAELLAKQYPFKP